MLRSGSVVPLLTLLFTLTVTTGQATGQQSPGELPNRSNHNVLLVTLDGLRWQEVFAGADETLMTKEAGGVKDIEALKTRFMRDSATARRDTLMPFFWTTIASQGVVIGNPEEGSKAVVTNGFNFSYPGYSEILCGFPDPKIDSNSKKYNENATVLEWLNRRPSLTGKVAAFCSWDVFPFIINDQRSGIPVNAGWMPLAGDWAKVAGGGQPSSVFEEMAELDRLGTEIPRNWPEVRYDYFTCRGAEEYLKLHQPRVMYVSLGETDDWAHAGRYDLYLDSAQRNDQYIQRLWETMQSMPQYRDNTTLILTTDHGRGDNRVDWKSHGEDIVDCQHIWMAVLGPGLNRPELRGTQMTQSQVAATVAAGMGYDYCADQPQAALPLPVFRAK